MSFKAPSFAIFVIDGPAWVKRGEIRPWHHDWRHETREEADRALANAWTITGVVYEVRETRS